MRGIYFVSLISIAESQVRSLPPEVAPSGDVELKFQQGLEKSTRQLMENRGLAMIVEHWLSPFIFSAAFGGACGVVYYSTGYWPFRRYLKRAAKESYLLEQIRKKSTCDRNSPSKSNICRDIDQLRHYVLNSPRPDQLLEWFSLKATALRAWAATFADWICVLSMASAFLPLVFLGEANLFNRACFLAGINGLLKAAIEHATLFTPVLGLDDIMEQYFPHIQSRTNITGAANTGWTVYPMGTPLAIIHSNHTFYSVMATFFIFKAWMKKSDKGQEVVDFGWVIPIVMTVVGLIEGTLLVISLGHYTADVIMGLAVAFLLCYNDHLEWIASKMNPFLKGAKKWKRKSEELEAQLEELHAMQHRRHKHLDEKKQIERMLNDRENDLESMNAEVHYKNQEIEKQKQQVEHWKRQFCCLKEAMSELQAERDNDIQSSQKHKRKSRKGRAQERKEATEDHAAEIAGLKETIALVEQAAEERTERFELLERAFLVKLDEMAEIEEARNNELVNVEEERDMLRKDFWEVCKMLKSEQAAAVASDQKKKDLELQVAEFAQVKREKAHLEDRLDWMSSVTSVTSIGRSISSSCRFDDSFDGRSSAGTNLRVTSPMGSSMCVSLGARSMPARLFEEEGTLFGDAVIHNSEDDVHGGHDHMHISDVDGVTSEATWEVVPIVKKDVGSGDCDCGDFGDTGRNVGKDDISKSSSSSATRLPSFLRTLAAEMRARARGSNAYWKLMSTHNGNLAWMRGSLSVLILLLLYVFRRERKNGLMKYVKVIIATNAFAKLLGQ